MANLGLVNEHYLHLDRLTIAVFCPCLAGIQLLFNSCMKHFHYSRVRIVSLWQNNYLLHWCHNYSLLGRPVRHAVVLLEWLWSLSVMSDQCGFQDSFTQYAFTYKILYHLHCNYSRCVWCYINIITYLFYWLNK